MRSLMIERSTSASAAVMWKMNDPMGVVVSQRAQTLAELRPIEVLAGCLVFIGLLDARLFEGVVLQVEVLIVGVF